MPSDMEIISIGNLNIDLIGKLAEAPRPDKKVLLDEFNRRPGGGAANFAVACTKLGLNTTFVGSIGKDSFGEEILTDLKERGVETSHVKKSDALTGFAFVFTTPENERFLIEHRGANSNLKTSDVKDKLLEKAGLLHASSVTPEMAADIGEKAGKHKIKTSLDLGAELTKVEKERLSKILEFYDICFMNEGTFEDIFGVKATEENVLGYFPRGLESLVVTLGSRGALATDGEEIIAGPTYDVDVKDATGAGDAFAAAFDMLILENASLREAINYATAEATIKVQHVGGRIGLPTKEELKNFMKSRK